ncbi:hypothetical protein [Pseudoxanthomonas sp. 10H]|uniref:hypothetical protein n=1 Tax=Pseudoxanthomonas sp. 10H TaxID=3242729 RepID=UPI00355780D0
MLEFLRQLAPRHPDALRPASPLRRMAAPGVSDATGAAHDAVADDRLAGVPAADEAGPPRLAPAPAPSPETGPLPPTVRAATALTRPAAPGPAAPGAQPRPAGHPLEAATGTAFLEDAPAAPPPAAMSMADRSVAIARGRRAGAVPAAATAAPVIPRALAVAAPISPATVARFAQERGAPATAPTIHLSIDRIEVRAPAPPRAPAAPSKPKPVREPQSLGDYLKGKVAP